MPDLNPFSYIEKWISEHGSAAVLREHVYFLKSQMATLEAVNRDLETQLKIYKAEAESSHAKLQEAEAEIQRLKQPVASPAFSVIRRNRSIDG